MGLSFGREARLITLLVIDIVFFFIELITGYAVGSLALVADSFHMLNDVMSLLVALYALKLSKKTDTKDPRYSYGWQRAEVLGALVNGVFLLALCFSIFMEAIERFINITEVTNPKIVIIVGSLGLASNIVGLFLFHDHGHSHGGHSHGHSHGPAAHNHQHTVAQPEASSTESTIRGSDDDVEEADPTAAGKKSASGAVQIKQGRGRASSGTDLRRVREESVGSLYGHPAQTRAFVVQAAHDMGFESAARSPPPSSAAVRIVGGERNRLPEAGETAHSHSRRTSEQDEVHEHDIEAEAAGATPKKTGIMDRLRRTKKDAGDHQHSDHAGHADSHSHPHTHSHANGNGAGHSHGGHSHAHGSADGSMNMRGVFLHVLGDALGNVGVIGAGVFILLSSASWRFYSDPAISFIITIIIFHSALPLVKSASFILLQGVPPTVPLETVKESMLNVDGVISVHELHIWQLSESKIVASVHVLVDCSSGDMDRYVEIAGKVRRVLHSWGVHSSTIQPEFVKGGIREAARMSGVTVAENAIDEHGRLITEDGELVETEVSKNGIGCLLACDVDASCAEAACCPPEPVPYNSTTATAAVAAATEPVAPAPPASSSDAHGAEHRHQH